MRLIGYVRVSGKGQATGGDGLGIQERKIRAWAKANGHKIVAIESDEGITGTVDETLRPGLAAALIAIEDKAADGLVAVSLDRIARSYTVQENVLLHVWNKNGTAFTINDGEVLRDDPEDPQRTMVRQILGSVAQFERALVVKRMRDGRASKRAAGRHSVGPYAYGTRAVGEGRERDAGPNPDEQAVVTRMLELRAAGHSYPQICTTLAAEGIMPRRAAAWSPMTVRNIILRHSGG